MSELENILIDIQDDLVPILDSYEQAVYHYIFRHTFLIGKKRTCFSAGSADIGYGSGAKLTKPSKKTRSDRLRTLEKKGCIKIIERSHRGITVELILPQDIIGLKTDTNTADSIDIENLDFFKDKRLLKTLLTREDNRCFYTGKKINVNNCYLDHVIPQAAGGDNSYKNIVASSYDANTLKSDKPVENFIRQLYKDDILSLLEFSALKQKITDLQDGNLVPKHESVLEAINS